MIITKICHKCGVNLFLDSYDESHEKIMMYFETEFYKMVNQLVGLLILMIIQDL